MPPPSWREILVAAIVLAALGAAGTTVAGAWPLFGRMLWLDEVHTALIAGDPSVRHAMGALADGADTNPPALFLLARGFAAPFGGVSPVALRAFAAVSMLLAVLGVYATARVAVPPLAAAAGALVLLNNPLVVRHAFEARFYGPLLAATAWFCFALVRTRDGRATFARAALLAGASVLACTLHYFGVFGVLAALAAEFTADTDHRPAARARRLLPALAGPAALAACWPLLGRQRAALGGTTWIPRADTRLALEYVRDLLPWGPPTWLAVAGVAALLVAGFAPRVGRWRAGGARRLAPALGTAAVAIIAIPALSALAQPALLARYAIASQVALAAVAALLVSRLRTTGRALACGVLLALAVVVLAAHASRSADDQAVVARLIEALRATDARVPIVFDMRQQHYAVVRAAPDLAARSRFVGLDTRRPDASAFARFERLIAARVSRWYPAYRTADERDVAALERFLFVTATRRDDVASRFGCDVSPVAPMVHACRRPGEAPPPAQ